MPLEGYVIVKTFPNELDAEVVAALLESSGIAASISADDAGDTIQSLELVRGVHVVVRKEDEAAARQLIAEQEKEGAGAAEEATGTTGEPDETDESE
jgi:hypothetical protein